MWFISGVRSFDRLCCSISDFDISLIRHLPLLICIYVDVTTVDCRFLFIKNICRFQNYEIPWGYMLYLVFFLIINFYCFGYCSFILRQYNLFFRFWHHPALHMQVWPPSSFFNPLRLHYPAQVGSPSRWELIRGHVRGCFLVYHQPLHGLGSALSTPLMHPVGAPVGGDFPAVHHHLCGFGYAPSPPFVHLMTRPLLCVVCFPLLTTVTASSCRGCTIGRSIRGDLNSPFHDCFIVSIHRAHIAIPSLSLSLPT